MSGNQVSRALFDLEKDQSRWRHTPHGHVPAGDVLWDEVRSPVPDVDQLPVLLAEARCARCNGASSSCDHKRIPRARSPGRRRGSPSGGAPTPEG
jgi:hypothetical protein